MAAEESSAKHVSPEEALQIAVRLHRDGRLEAAAQIYGQLLQLQPDHPDVLHLLGVLCHQAGKSREAVELIRRGIALMRPPVAGAYNNLGNVLKEMGELSEAEAAYQRAIELDPQDANALNNLGTVLRAQARTAEAIATYRKAIELQPDHADAHLNLGHAYRRLEDLDAAIEHYMLALSLRQHHSDSYRNLADALATKGRIQDAIAVYEKWLGFEPEHPVALHLLAACSGRNAPPRAATSYVQTYFDDFADSFDLALEQLDYRAPGLVADALVRSLGSPRSDLHILDAGCGTGLCGPLLRPHAHHLVGVDLSGKMLERARSRQVYDDLVRADLVEFMSAGAARFDVIASADTLIYFGALQAAFDAARQALKPGGLLAFTLEADQGVEPDTGYRLNPHGRYSHTQEYVRRALQQTHLQLVSLKPETLRMELGEPVVGLVVVAVR
jgi:predicted TPR repeat methyltransferase